MALSVKKNISRFGEFSGVEYFLARAFRILPPLTLVVVFVYALTKIAAFYDVEKLPEGVLSARAIYSVDIQDQLLAFKTFFSNGDLTGVLNGPLWSLQYEIQLYILTGLAAIILFSRRMWLLRLLACGGMYTYLHYAFYLRSLNGSLTLQFLWYLIFGMGMVAFSLSVRAKTEKLWLITIAGIAACFLLLATYDAQKLLIDMDSAPELIWAQFAFGVGCSALIVLLSRSRKGSRFASLGSFSYTLYIAHFPILIFFYFVIVNNLPRYSIQVAWVLALAAAAFCILFSKVISGSIENASSQRAFFMRGITAFRSRYLRGVSE